MWRQQTEICGETVSLSLYLFFVSDLTNSQIGANWSNCETSRLVYSGGVPFVRSLRMDRDWGGGGYGNCYCVWEGNKWSKSERSLSDDVWLHWSLSSPDVEPSVAILSADTSYSMFYLHSNFYKFLNSCKRVSEWLAWNPSYCWIFDQPGLKKVLCWLCYWSWSDKIRCEFGWEMFNRRWRKVLYCPSGHLAPFLNHVHWPFIALERPFCRLESGVKATGLVS